MTFQWWSEPFGPNGGVTGDGIRNQLGRPKLNNFEILVRESIQNSWDARVDDGIQYKITFKQLGENASRWQQLIGTIPGADTIEAQNFDPETWVLIISDRSTSGLGGPLRSDEKIPSGVSADFVQFLRNIGEPRDKKLGGGTYGFGKSIYYRISSASTILVDTQTLESGPNQRRLMGASISGPFVDANGIRCTGRHWWGQVENNVAMPILGQKAADFAARLGLPGFNDNTTGTDIVIVAPDLELDDLKGDIAELSKRIRAYIYWHAWPKLYSGKDSASVNARITFNDHDIHMPEPTTIPGIREMCSCLNEVRHDAGAVFHMKKTDRSFGGNAAIVPIGRLSIQPKTRFSVGVSHAASDISDRQPFGNQCHHIARMRAPELIVDYYPGPSFPNEQIEYLGVFKVCDQFDEPFSAAEPPTHDSWESSILPSHWKSLVTRSVAFLNKKTQEHVAVRTGAQSKSVRGLGRLSNKLGVLIEPMPEVNEETNTKPGSTVKKRGSKTRSFKILNDSRVTLREGAPFVESLVQVNPNSQDSHLEVKVGILASTGNRDNPSVSVISDSTVTWENISTGEIHEGSLPLSGTEEGEWRVRAPMNQQAALRLIVKAVSRDD